MGLWVGVGIFEGVHVMTETRVDRPDNGFDRGVGDVYYESDEVVS